jgi:diguanylate cyclase (GGDEF)-like protein
VARRARPAPIELYVLGVVLASVIALALAIGAASPGDFLGDQPELTVLFTALVVVAELNTLKWLRLDEGGEITSSWAFAIAIVLVASPATGMIVLAVAAMGSDLLHRKPLVRAVFNGAQTSLSLGLGSLVLAAFGVLDDLQATDGEVEPVWFLAVALSGLVVFLANGVFTCTAIALHEGTSPVAMIRRGVGLNLATDGTLVALAPIYVVVAQRSLLLLPLVLVTALLVHRNTRLALAREHAATHDALTGLLNREAFQAGLEAHLKTKSKQRSALILLDLDGFKSVNARLGTQTGDEVLKEAGRRLVASYQPGQLVARVGGDQFAVLLTRCESIEAAEHAARDLRAQLSEPFEALGYPVSVRASVGVAVFPDHADAADRLLEVGDLAVFRAKTSQSGTATASGTEDARHRGRLGLLAELRSAIERGQLELHYQPQLDLASGSVCAVEALVRWRHPRLGLVLPGEFVPYAEQTELMGPLTHQVLTLALRDCAGWHRQHAVRVTVNASAQSLHDLHFPSLVRNQLAVARLPPRWLELEITEHTVLSQPDRAREVLTELRAVGVNVAIDDFGTGFSSLTNLRALPVSIIKIDRSFVDGMRSHAEDLEIVRAIVQLARSLGLGTVAEGVEEPGDVELLRSLGCDVVQGHAVAPAMPLPDLLRWLDRATPPRFETA